MKKKVRARLKKLKKMLSEHAEAYGAFDHSCIFIEGEINSLKYVLRLK